MSSKPYFAFFPGDYLADTMGLSCCEHGVYVLLLAVSWQRGPLPDDMDHLSRLAANPPIEALRFILEHYWTRTERGWVNARLERERQYIVAKSEKARASALARWGDANAMRTHSGRNATHTHTQKKKTPPTPPRGEWIMPDWINADAWAEFEDHRKQIRKPLRDLARKKAANLLRGLSHEQQQQCIDRSIQAGWAGLFPDKVKTEEVQPARDWK
jgi:uncharacterized protein YdaU (DUF1376 family)